MRGQRHISADLVKYAQPTCTPIESSKWAGEHLLWLLGLRRARDVRMPQ